MTIHTPKIISAALVFLGALAMLGAAGTLSTASAAALVINSPAKLTSYPQVTLTVTAPVGSVDMRFQNESDTLSLSAWEPVAGSRRWTLSAENGVKTVKVQFRDASTITTDINDPLYKATIILDSVIDTSFNPASTIYPGSAIFVNTAAAAPATAANAVAVYPVAGNANDGKTVTVGTFDNGNGDTDIKVIRYNTNGSIDVQFVYEHPGLDSGNAVALQPDGKIVVVGTMSRGVGVTDVCVVRLNDNGTLDTGFGINGVIDYIGSGRDSGNAVAIQADEKIVVAGTFNSAAPFAWVLRFNADGTKDTTVIPNSGFSTGGSIAFLSGSAHAVAVQSDQKIVVVGTYNNGVNGTSAWALRLDSTGSVDASFNASGSSPGHNLFGSNGAHTGSAVAIAATGKIVVVGTYNASRAWVLQLNSNGTLDTGFNTVGNLAFDAPVASSGRGVAIQPADGRIVVTGTYDFGAGNTSLFVARINNSGTLATTLLDTTFNYGNYDYAFGTVGKYTGRGVALQPDGKIVAVGSGDGDGSQFIAGNSTMLTLRLHEKTWPLTATTIGSGTVSVFPGVLTGGTGNFVPGSTIQLTATPTPLTGATFTGWAGCDTVNGTLCSVTMNAARNVTATFTLSFPLTVSVTGVGSVTSVPGTISCNSASGPGCSNSFLNGTSVTLTATPTWYTLSGLWGGGSCSGSIATPCTVIMDQARTVTTTFVPNLTVRVVGFGDYPTLTQAYGVANSSGPTATIQAKDSTQVIFPEAPMNLALPVVVTFQGGKGSDFSAAAVGYTSVIGPLNISNGRLNASNLKVRQP